MGKGRVEYVPPSPEVLVHFTRAAYRERVTDPVSRESVHEFAGFMQAVASALAKDLTRKANGELDRGDRVGLS